MNDDLFNSEDNSLDNNFACSEFFADCASPKSIDENKQRRKCRSASKPNCLQSCKDNKLVNRVGTLKSIQTALIPAKFKPKLLRKLQSYTEG